MTKVVKTKVATNAESKADHAGGISWIPSGPVESSKKKMISIYHQYLN